MTLKIGPSPAVLGALRRLDTHTQSVGKTFERLSSGMRINSAGDDPAGLSVASKLALKSKVLNQAKRNISDGVSALQIADVAINEIQNLVTRMAELAEQSASGTYSDEQRRALDTEYQALDKEIRRITATTSFNGIDLLQGSVASAYDIEQLTNTSGAGLAGAQLAVNGDGRFVSYYNQVTGAFEQQDTLTGEVTTIAVASAPITDLMIRSSASGDRVVFLSRSDLTGDNALGVDQFFLFDKSTNEITQLTGNVINETGPFLSFDLSADGSTLVFSSGNSYVDGGTLADGVVSGGGFQQIFALDLQSGVFNEIASRVPTVGYGGIQVSSDGSKFVFSSNRNNGNNADGGLEVFYGETFADTDQYIQITNQGAGALQIIPTVNNEGQVVFSAFSDLVGNGNTFTQLFLYDAASDSISQITNFTQNYILSPGFTDSGDEVFLLTDANLDGNNPDNLTGFARYSLDTGEFQTDKLLPTLGVFSSIGVSGDGRRYFVIGSGDETGENPDGSNELFVIDAEREKLSLNIQVGAGETNVIEASIDQVLAELEGVTGFIIGTQDAARGALRAMRRNVDILASIRGKIGSSLSRFEAAAEVIASQEVETRAAESRITDADVALEAANLVKNQILQNFSTAVLAQANLQSGLVLQLLQPDRS